jgi:FMN phosphatase YigB (HAD superfamily)
MAIINTIIFDMEGVLGEYESSTQFNFYPGIIECIAELRDVYDLYYLTNVLDATGPYFNKHVTKMMAQLGFVGGIGSNNYSFKKPDHRFYKRLLEKYSLDPSTCLFVDDKKHNVIAARELGMQSFVHRSSGVGLNEEIKRYLS